MYVCNTRSLLDILGTSTFRRLGSGVAGFSVGGCIWGFFFFFFFWGMSSKVGR